MHENRPFERSPKKVETFFAKALDKCFAVPDNGYKMNRRDWPLITERSERHETETRLSDEP